VSSEPSKHEVAQEGCSVFPRSDGGSRSELATEQGQQPTGQKQQHGSRAEAYYCLDDHQSSECHLGSPSVWSVSCIFYPQLVRVA
jgi:hypothetical protein